MIPKVPADVRPKAVDKSSATSDDETLAGAIKDIKLNDTEGYHRNVELELQKRLARSKGPSDSSGASTSAVGAYGIERANIKKESIRTLTKEEKREFEECVQREHLKFNELNIVEVNIHNTLPRYYMKSEDLTVRHMGRDPVRKRPSLASIFPEEKEVQGAQGAQGRQVVRGGSKILTSRDLEYVKLEAISESFPLESSIKFNQLVIEKLRKYPSLCSSFFVSDKEMISSDGGHTLATVLNAGYNFELYQFFQLVTDLYQMQKEGLFMTDISLNNLVCREAGKMVQLIDLDSINDGNQEHHPICLFLTTGLIDSFLSAEKEFKANKDPELAQGKIKIFHQGLSNMVSYALLKSLIESTEMQSITTKGEYRFSSIGTEPNMYLQSSGGDSYAQQKRISLLTQKWIKKNVKPEYQNMMRKFSINPHLQDGIIDFSEVLDFKPSLLRF